MSKITKPNSYSIALASASIKRGNLVAFPTETVYGLGANGLDDMACKKIYVAKGRPSDNPLILHVYGVDQAKTLVKVWTKEAEILTKAFWPGPLTIILPAKDNIPKTVTAGLSTVALRCPDNIIALDLIKATNVPIAAPSANLSGRPSPTTARHVDEDLGDKVDYILDGGQCDVGVESTIIDLSVTPPAILRPGHISAAEISKLIGPVNEGIISESVDNTPKAPGMKYRHYAPKGDCTIIIGNTDNVSKYFAREIDPKSCKIALLIFDDTIEKLSNCKEFSKEIDIFSMGNRKNPSEMAHRLYESLRRCDEKNIEKIFCEGIKNIKNDDDSIAVMNRLLKSAGNKVINL